MESALISRWYGVPESFILLLNWNWCSYRLEMGVSGNFWIVVKDVKPLVVYDVDARWLRIQWSGNVLHLVLIWGTPIYFAFLRWHQCSSLVVTVFLGILFSSIREIEVPYVFDWEHGYPQHEMQGNRASSCGEGELSWVFSSCGRHLVYILELRRGWPFETRVCSAKSGLLSRYDGHLGKLSYAWQENTDASEGEPGSQASLISWHSYIAIHINFHEESGIIIFWSTELSAPLEVSNGCEALCPE